MRINLMDDMQIKYVEIHKQDDTTNSFVKFYCANGSIFLMEPLTMESAYPSAEGYSNFNPIAPVEFIKRVDSPLNTRYIFYLKDRTSFSINWNFDSELQIINFYKFKSY